MKYFKIIATLLLILYYGCRDKIVKETELSPLTCVLPVKLISSSIDIAEPLIVEDNNSYLKLFIDFRKNGKRVAFIRIFKRKNSSSRIEELKLIKDFDNSIVDSVFLPALLLKDSSFVYIYDEEKYPTSIPKGIDDWKYTCKKIHENKYVLIKAHLHDPLFKEIYIYNRDFELKMVGIFQGSDSLIFEK